MTPLKRVSPRAKLSADERRAIAEAEAQEGEKNLPILPESSNASFQESALTGSQEEEQKEVPESTIDPLQNNETSLLQESDTASMYSIEIEKIPESDSPTQQNLETAVSQGSSFETAPTDEKVGVPESKEAGEEGSMLAHSEKEGKPEMQVQEMAGVPLSDLTYEQLYEFAQMFQQVNARMQKSIQEKQAKQHPADLLVQALADTPFADFHKIAEKQKRKINQGITMPEALFTIYKTCAMQYGLKGRKIPMGDLISKALIKYLVEVILPELAEEHE